MGALLESRPVLMRMPMFGLVGSENGAGWQAAIATVVA